MYQKFEKSHVQSGKLPSLTEAIINIHLNVPICC